MGGREDGIYMDGVEMSVGIATLCLLCLRYEFDDQTNRLDK